MITSAVADIPRLFTAAAEWGACLVFVLIVARRFSAASTTLLVAVGAVALGAVQLWAGSLPLAFWIPGMLLAAATMYGLLFATLAVSPITAGYLTARAFVLAELVASAHWQLDRFYWSDATAQVHVVLMLPIYAVLLTLAWLAERRHFPRDQTFTAGGGELISAVAIAGATFAISNLSFVNANTAFSGRLGPEIFYIRTLVDLAGYIALYVQHEVRRSLDARREAEAMGRLLTSQHDQYQISRRAIEEVNRKYHDMKHHLDAIRAETDPAVRERIVDDLEQSIAGHGTRVRSGNLVLDAIVTGKQMQAREKGIELAVVADGRLLAFMRPLHLTAIVGNALDNAIEAVDRVPNASQRTIKLSVFSQDEFVLLRVENPYDGLVSRRGGVILSRKSGEGHGYGLRNISAAAEHYGGSMTVREYGEWFTVSVLVPRPQSPADASVPMP